MIVSNEKIEKTQKNLQETLENELWKAFNEVGCDLRCFDWLNYNPDFYYKEYNNPGFKGINYDSIE